MRRTNSFTLEIEDNQKLEVSVYELRPLDLLEIHKIAQEKKSSTGSLGEYERLLPLCTNLSKEQLLKLYPSEFAIVFENFKEVNASFLAPWPTIKSAIDKVGLVDWLVDLVQKSGLLEKLKKTISLDLQSLSASSLKEGISDPNSMDGGITKSLSTTGEELTSLSEKPPPRVKGSVH